MERLFSPCTRLYDTLERRGGLSRRFRRHPELQELNLDVSTEELLSTERAFTYADLYAMLGNQKAIAWLTPHAAVAREGVHAYINWNLCRFNFNVDGQNMSALALSLGALSEILDVVRCLLVANAREIYELEFRNVGQYVDVFFNAPSFAFLVEQCKNLKVLRLRNLVSLSEDQLRVLGDFSKPGLEIVLDRCGITVAAAAVLAQILGRNQGPTKLDHCCETDNFVLADGLRGNSRLQSWRPRLSDNYDVVNREFLAIAGGLRENKGLVDLNLTHYVSMSENTWDVFCDSLKTHPTLQVLDLRTGRRFLPPLAPAHLKVRIQSLVDMLKVNASIHTIQLDGHYKHELFRGGLVLPYLELNMLRLRVRAIQKILPIAYRAKVLGRALLAVRSDPNSLWMFLSGNAEIAFSVDDHAGCEPPYACYYFCCFFQCCCCRYCHRYSDCLYS
jgi:hypothetical protein